MLMIFICCMYRVSVSVIPAILWLLLSIIHFVEGNVEKGIVFMVCAIGWAVVEIIFIKWQKNK